MDACLEIFLPQLDLKNELMREVNHFELAGNAHAQESEIYNWRDMVQLRASKVPNHVLTRIPSHLASKDWKYFAIDRRSLDQLERLVYDPSEVEESPLESFLALVTLEWAAEGSMAA